MRKLKVTFTDADGLMKEHTLTIATTKYTEREARKRNYPSAELSHRGLSFFIDGELVQSLIVSYSEYQTLVESQKYADHDYYWFVDDLGHKCIISPHRIRIIEITYGGTKAEGGFTKNFGTFTEVVISASEDDLIEVVREELVNAPESDSLPIYTLENVKVREV